MAKRQVTEDDLASGMKAFGGFPTFAQSKPQRDNPFRDTREPVTPPPAAKPVAIATPAPKAEIVAKPLAREVTKSVVELPVSVPEPVIEQKKPVPIKAEATPEPVVKVAPKVVKAPEVSAPKAVQSEISYERVTLPMTADMREGFERMARELQRKRSQKNERITANTVMRVALEYFMDRFSVEQTDRVNTEEELLDAAKQQLGRK